MRNTLGYTLNPDQEKAYAEVMESIVCTKCGEAKSLDCFSRNARGRFGRRVDCKTCVSAYKSGWRESNIESARAAGRASYQRNAAKRITHSHMYYRANREACLALSIDYKRRNVVRVSQKEREWYLANFERLRAKRLANLDHHKAIRQMWTKNNREKRRIIAQNRRARELKAEGRYSESEVRALLRRQKERCASPACRKQLRGKYHHDHILPLSRGGSNWIKNIQLLCPSCNQRKSYQHPIDWAQRLGFLI